MRGIELLETLRRLNKPYYSIADLEKITGLPRNSLYVSLKRWVGGGIFERAAQGIYLPRGTTISIESVASQIYIPSYLSFESALSRYGILNVIPYTLTFATTRKTRNCTLQGREVEFRQIAPALFFGFEIKEGYLTALPEKAFLDEIYFMLRGKTTLDTDELDIKKLSIQALKTLSKRFPPYVQKYVTGML